MSCEQLQPLLISERDMVSLCQVATLLARGDVVLSALRILRMERVTALRKPKSGVRGIVVRDVLRRLVVRTMAKQCSKSAEAATAPFQCALQTRAGSECVSHVLQTLTDLDPNATTLSVDGVGAFDLISRKSMLAGLLQMEGGDRMLPCGRTTWEQFTILCRAMVENKGTHSCPCCSVLDNMLYWLLWPRGWKSENDFSLSWMICTLSPALNVPWTCTIFCGKNCGATPRSVCTKVKRAS